MPPHSDVSNAVRKMKGPGTVFSALLFVATFVLFPYVGMLLRITCSHNPTTDLLFHDQRQRVPTSAQSDYYLDTEPASELGASVQDIMEDQQKRMESLCSARNANTTVYNSKLVTDLYHHLLVDDTRKLLFCYVPKVACSNWKRVFLMFAGLVDPSETLRPSVEVFRQVKSLNDYSPLEQEYRLRHYFKFMFIRDPRERLVSAYRNKIEHPVTSNPAEQTLWDDIRTMIMQFYRRTNDMNESPYPTFSEFVHFLSDSDSADMNEHYKPVSALCQPCSVHYNYVGNFETLRRDADRILQYLNVDTSWFWDRGRHFTNPTQSLVEKYYSMLRSNDITLIENKFQEDILLYKYLFPSVKS